MIRVGKPPYLDVGLGGDRRFCADYAEVRGIPIRYHLLNTPGENDLREHTALWREYLGPQPLLKAILMRTTGLECGTARNGSVSHVDALWAIREELLADSL